MLHDYSEDPVRYPEEMGPKTLDSRGHRLPWAEPAEEVEIDCFQFVDADYRGLFQPLDEFVYLPSHYLLAEQERLGLRKARTHTLNRLTAFCTGSKQQGKILFAPKGQFHQAFAHARHKVYGITPYVRRLLRKKELDCAHRPPRTSWFVHQLMQACVVFSLKFTTPPHLTFRGRSAILTHEKVGAAKDAKNPLAIPLPGYEEKRGRERKTLIPDDLFALENEAKKNRYFWIEVDRDTESDEPRDPSDVAEDATYFGRKIEHIFELLRAGTIRWWWGISRPHILIVTVNQRRANQILRRIAACDDPEFASYFYVTVVSYFDEDWRVPPDVLRDLYTRDWMTVAGPRKIIDECPHHPAL